MSSEEEGKKKYVNNHRKIFIKFDRSPTTLKIKGL